jgi:hypothetical protein
MVDAALCAITAHHLLNGTFKTYGDTAEGHRRAEDIVSTGNLGQ